MPIADELKRRGILTFKNLALTVGDKVSFIIEDLLVEHSINIIAGDSGIGKTPLCLTMALCIAGGVPFLGMDVTKKRIVLYCDAESSKRSFYDVVSVLSKYLGFPEVPENFHVWSPNWDKSLQGGDYATALFNRVELLKPDIVFLDPLRIFFPLADMRRDLALQYLKQMRQANERMTTWMIVHHTRKPGIKPEHKPKPIADDPSRWFHEVAGQHALVNHVDTRLGLEETPAASGSELTLAGFVRLHGPINPLYLIRSRNDSGEPEGYMRASSLRLLRSDQQEAFAKLPPPGQTFRFKDAQVAVSKGDASVTRFLQKCLSLSVITKVEGGYQKTQV